MFGPVLVFTALAAAVPRLLLGSSQYIEYDGYWHIFIAQQDNWNRFWLEIYANAHPPLYFLLLKAVLHFGHSLIVYRSISLLTGIGSVALVGWIARKVTGSNIRAYQSALLYGLALPGIIISCEVRSYMLSVFFVLLSWSSLLDISESGITRGEAGARAGFAFWAILACLSHYFAFFYSGAAILLLLGRFAMRRSRGEAASWKAEAATILPLAACILTLYESHAGRLAQIQDHLIPYYYDPLRQETIARFLLRNWKNFVNLFSPYSITSDAAAFGVLIAVLIGVVSAALSLLRARDSAAVRALWTLLITAFMLTGFVLAALAGKYPFGGDLRQQFLLFPFVVLCAAILAERLARAFYTRAPVNARRLLNSLVIAATVLVSVVCYERYPKQGGKLEDEQIQVFDRLEPRPQAIYLDQFNLITFFMYHDTWAWSFLNLPQPVPEIDVYRLRRGPEQMLVFRDTRLWNNDPDDPATYTKLAECLRAAKIADLSVFSVRQSPPKPPLSDLKQVRRTMVSLASASSVCVQRLAVNSMGWYATIQPSNCDSIVVPPQQVTGSFDDTSDDIQYIGFWTHALFPDSARGTVSFSNDPRSVARLSFTGSEITYVYTKAFNRGIAEITLDGVARGDVDLYSKNTVWQARMAFRNLTPGKHTFELTVAGRKQAAATDQYVDLDALIVR